MKLLLLSLLLSTVQVWAQEHPCPKGQTWHELGIGSTAMTISDGCYSDSVWAHIMYLWDKHNCGEVSSGSMEMYEGGIVYDDNYDWNEKDSTCIHTQSFGQWRNHKLVDLSLEEFEKIIAKGGHGEYSESYHDYWKRIPIKKLSPDTTK